MTRDYSLMVWAVSFILFGCVLVIESYMVSETDIFIAEILLAAATFLIFAGLYLNRADRQIEKKRKDLKP